MESAKRIEVEVAYAVPGDQLLLSLDIEEGQTAEDAIRTSGILDRFPEIDLKKNKVGVFGKVCKLNQELRDGDRVEIYRELIADPKEARKKRAAKAKADS